ncbi:hypothetical protein [Enemella sp. A6]|uniref:hypothetical protein n=1 Tax=Enemella sp. A6 TaxID=3440152 RepID=UPI003EBBD84C
MIGIKSLQWPLIIGLGALALVRPLVRIVGGQLGLAGSPAVPIAITAVVSAFWILVVGLSKTAHPVLTLLFTALTYAVLSIILSGILSPILDGEMQGPLANPISIIPVLAINTMWGLAAGALALLLQHMRSTRRGGRVEPR